MPWRRGPLPTQRRRELCLSSGVSQSPQEERALLLLIVDIGVMLLLAGAMLFAARLYLGDATVTKEAGETDR